VIRSLTLFEHSCIRVAARSSIGAPLRYCRHPEFTNSVFGIRHGHRWKIRLPLLPPSMGFSV
jgi:hypothetical protein